MQAPHTAAGVRHGDQLSLYLDGELQVQKTIGSQRVNTLTVNIGVEDDSTDVIIEDVQLFDYALFPEEIAEIPLLGGVRGGSLLAPLSNDGPVLLGDEEGTVVTTIITYYYINGIRVAQQRDGVFTWIHADHLSSATRITDVNGLEVRRLSYTSFGEEAENQGTGDEPKYKYTGKEHDATGLYYYGARYYDPALSRFITADTIYDHGPQGLNRYSYALNNPIIYRDPTGHLHWSYADEQDPQVWEDPRPPEERPITIGRDMSEGGEYIDLGDGVRVRRSDLRKARPVLEEYQDAPPAERAFHEWLASDPITRVGIAQRRNFVGPPDDHEMIIVTGGSEETFLKQLYYLNEIGEDLDSYSLDKLDTIYVEARKEDQWKIIGLSVGFQAGMTLGNIRATKKTNVKVITDRDTANQMVDNFKDGAKTRPIVDRRTGKVVGEITLDGSKVIRTPHVDKGTPQRHWNLEDKTSGINIHIVEQ